MTKRIAVISSGLSNPSSTRLLADQLAAATTDALAADGIEAQTDFIELRGLAHDLADNLLTGFAKLELQEVIDTVTHADAVIAVSPIFNASMSGLFKMFFDVIDKDTFIDKPVLLGATAGTPRHSLAIEHSIRPMFAYLRARTMGTAVFAASQDWAEGGKYALTQRITRAGEELASVLSHNTKASGPKDPFTDVTPFEELLKHKP